MEDNTTIAEEYIKKFPYTGHIKLTFIRICPTIKLIERNIPLQYLSKDYKAMYGDLKQSGISLRLNQCNVELDDYYKFMCKLFPDFDVQNCQPDKVGKPDFFLINKETEFYVEVKNGNDGIRCSQMTWLTNNQEKEIWFLFIGGIKLSDEGKFIYHYENP